MHFPTSIYFSHSASRCPGSSFWTWNSFDLGTRHEHQKAFKLAGQFRAFEILIKLLWNDEIIDAKSKQLKIKTLTFARFRWQYFTNKNFGKRKMYRNNLFVPVGLVWFITSGNCTCFLGQRPVGLLSEVAGKLVVGLCVGLTTQVVLLSLLVVVFRELKPEVTVFICRAVTYRAEDPACK